MGDIRKIRIQIIQNKKVMGLKRKEKLIALEDGKMISYDFCVLATGSRAFIPPPFLPYRNYFNVLNNLKDAKDIDKKLSTGQVWGIIGGGFIGCELAYALKHYGCQVILFEVGTALMQNFFPKKKELNSRPILNIKVFKWKLKQSLKT